MTTPSDEPCSDWCTEADVELCEDCGDLDADVLAEAITVVSGLMFQLSGRQYSGTCTRTVRPHQNMLHFDGPPSKRTGPAWSCHLDGCWCNHQPARSDSGCGSLPIVVLGDYPVTSITSVKIDGQTLSNAHYRIDNFNMLVRTDGEGWPCCQDQLLASTEVGTFEVVYGFGMAPPSHGRMAAAVFSCELAKAWSNRECRLPKRITSITRQGMTAVLLDPFAMMREGKTGIYEVDLFLASCNPGGLRGQPLVVTPDTWRPHVQTTWSGS